MPIQNCSCSPLSSCPDLPPDAKKSIGIGVVLLAVTALGIYLAVTDIAFAAGVSISIFSGVGVLACTCLFFRTLCKSEPSDHFDVETEDADD